MRSRFGNSARDDSDKRTKRRLIDLANPAGSLRTTARHLRRPTDGRTLPNYTVGGKLRFDASELDDRLDGNRGPSPEAA